MPGLARVQYNFDRTELADAEWLRHGDREYYSFAPARGWRVVVLDPYQLALIGHAPDDPRRREAVELIGARNPGVDPSGVGGAWFRDVSGLDKRFVPYNGGLGQEQLRWLRTELRAAAAADERVLIFCHVILHPEACGGSTMVWDYPEALAAIASDDAKGCVAAVLCGHDHFGQYHHDVATGVHHCTFCSPLNKGDDGDAFGLVCVRDDAIEIRGPKVDDLLPAERKGKPTGRPAKAACEAAPTCAQETPTGEKRFEHGKWWRYTCEAPRVPRRHGARCVRYAGTPRLRARSPTYRAPRPPSATGQEGPFVFSTAVGRAGQHGRPRAQPESSVLSRAPPSATA